MRTRVSGRRRVERAVADAARTLRPPNPIDDAVAPADARTVAPSFVVELAGAIATCTTCTAGSDDGGRETRRRETTPTTVE